MKKLGIDRSTDLSYSNNRSRGLRPDQSHNSKVCSRSASASGFKTDQQRVWSAAI